MWASITPICPMGPHHHRSRPPAPPAGARATVGLLMLRSYILASDTAHYDATIRALEARGSP
jgi:cobalamin biosynthesis Mg chelatase CobN